MIRIFLVGAVMAMGLWSWSPVFGHTVFKKGLEKKYPKTRVSCELCHVKGEPKTKRNEFGELLFTKLKDQNFTKQWEAFGDDAAGKSKFEKETMLPAFLKVFDEIKVTTNPDKVTYDSLMSEAKLPGLKVRKAGASSKDDDDDEEEDKKTKDKGQQLAKRD